MLTKLMLVRMLMMMMQKAVDEVDASENVDEDDAEGCSITILVTGLSASSSGCYRWKYDG